MNYCLTVKDNLITGVHEKEDAFTEKTFLRNPWLTDSTVVPIKEPAKYEAGVDIRCYYKNGKMRPLLWCIEQGYAKVPDGYELIGKELVKLDAPVSEAPPTIRQRLEAQENQIAQLLEQLSEVVKMGADIAEIKAQIGKAEIEAPEARKTL